MRQADGTIFLRSRRADIWRRGEADESLHEIGRALGKDHRSIQFSLSQHGGIVPAVRRRSQGTLRLAEREDISRGIASGRRLARLPEADQGADAFALAESNTDGSDIASSFGPA